VTLAPRNCPICGREPDEEYTPGCWSCEQVRQFIEGTGDPNKRPIGFLNAPSCVEEK
jgi:hypothetical protein